MTHAALGRFKLAGDAVRDDPQALAAWWRGAVGRRFPDGTAFHGHEGETVYAAFECEREVPCRLKDVALVGFAGAFVTDLALPDHLALGRSVSHGFGWFREV